MTKIADTIFYNGHIYSADAEDAIYQAVAVKDGLILDIGADEAIKAYAGPDTELTDLEGKMMIPGIVDSHLHLYWGGKLLAGFSLDYEPLAPEEIVRRIAGHIAKAPCKGADDWVQVRGWLRIGGSDVTRRDLDAIDTRRPIILFSSDCHFIALNSRGLELTNVTRDTPDPPDGIILRDADGEPTGIIEDGPAMRIYDAVSALGIDAAADIIDLAQKALHREGVTTVMDARAEEDGFEPMKRLMEQGRLTMRICGAREITPVECGSPEAADKVMEEKVVAFARKYDCGHWTPTPGLSVRHVKLFIDGILHTSTAYMLEPYYENRGTAENPNWQQGSNVWHPYISQEIVDAVLLSCGKYGYHPHMHVIGEGSIELACNSIEKLRKAYPEKDIRPCLAHNEQVAVHQFKRVADLGAYLCLSFHWAGYPDSMHEITRNLLGEYRYANCLEPHGRYIDAGAKVAYGSDWPIDPLNEWSNFQVGCTRKLPGPDNKRMDSDRDLTMKEVLRAATIVASEALGKEKYIGSLEKGKFADLAILNQNVFTVAPEEIMNTKVLRTVVGGKTVYQA